MAIKQNNLNIVKVFSISPLPLLYLDIVSTSNPVTIIQTFSVLKLIRTGITHVRKSLLYMHSYMRDTACRWCIFKSTKIIWDYVKHF